MSLLLRVIYAAHCRSTHHKLAIDALKDLRCSRPARWRDMFLQHHELYLQGAKDPDKKFKDFRNHVLHVSQNNWGGAVKKTQEWYGRTVEALRARDWPDAAYCGGVMSHYYTDPIMPFHTGQSQAENNIHRAAEWSICKTYEELRRIAVDEIGLPEVEAPRGDDWLEQMVIEGATRSHRYYNAFIKQYDFAAGRSDPPAGLNKKCRRMIAELVGYAAVGLACILDEAIEEADVRAPRNDLTVATFVATVKVPIRWVTKKMADAEERALIEAMYQEYEATGKVEKNLPEDDRAVREAVAKELGGEGSDEPSTEPIKRQERISEPVVEERQPQVQTSQPIAEREVPREEPAKSILPMPVVETDVPDEPLAKPQAVDAAHRIEELNERNERQDVEEAAEDVDDAPVSKPLRFYLSVSDPVVDAPSIGNKTAKRFNKIGVKTVSDLLALEPASAAAKINARHITPDVLGQWQAQATLACCIPQIRGHDAQILVACGYDHVDAVADADVNRLLAETEAFAATSQGERIIRSGKAPDHAEVSDWINWAQQARPLKAA